MVGVPNTVVSVVNWRNVTAAVRAKPVEAERQRLEAGEAFAATFVRLKGGDYRVCMTVEQWCAMYREAM